MLTGTVKISFMYKVSKSSVLCHGGSYRGSNRGNNQVIISKYFLKIFRNQAAHL